MSKKTAKVLPIIFPKTDKMFEEKDCIICSNEFDNNEAYMPCGHKFHAYCVLIWFEKKMECPMCRTKFSWAKSKKQANVKEEKS